MKYVPSENNKTLEKEMFMLICKDLEKDLKLIEEKYRESQNEIEAIKKVCEECINS